MELAKKFISTINTAISNALLYSGAENQLEESAHRVVSVLNEIQDESFEIMIIGDDLICNRIVTQGSGIHGGSLVKRLKRRGITHVEFLSGISCSEIKQFIVDIAQKDIELQESPHIKLGVTGLRMGSPEIDYDIDFGELPDIDLGKSNKDKYEKNSIDISRFRRLETAGLKEIVINIIATFKKEANLLKLLSPVKTYSEYTYTHATNVSILSMFQAELLGIEGSLLHDIGIAALLHDVGKLFVSNQILNKNGPLDNSEFSEMTQHTLLGARYLVTIKGITKLAPIVALEHHRKYDGTGYPFGNSNGKRQHICSQIVAIADFFDAMRSWRPYRKSWQARDIITIMKKKADSDFNPFLLDNFISMLHKALSQ